MLHSFGGEKLNVICQVTVDITRSNRKVDAIVQVQKEAPVEGTDLLPKLGFSLIQSQSADTAVDHFCKQEWKVHNQPDAEQSASVESPSSTTATVRLITATKLPARHVKVVRARVDGVGEPRIMLFLPQNLLELKGLCVEEAVLEPDGELCVSVPIKNSSCEPVCRVPGEVLGELQPVTVVPDPCNVAALMGEVATERGADEPELRSERLISEVCMEESLSEVEVQGLTDLVLDFADVFALDQSELGFTDVVTHTIDTSDSSSNHPGVFPLL